MTDTLGNAGAVERKEDFGSDTKGKTGGQTKHTYGRWIAEIKASDKTFDNWKKRARELTKRYRSENDQDDVTTETQSARPGRFAILWSNVSTIMPALYSRLPEPDISRTYKDKDPVARAASMILERATRHEIQNGMHKALKSGVKDRLITARGQVWVRYVPTYGEQTQDKIFLQSEVDEETQEVSYSMPNGDPLAEGQSPQFEDGKPYVNDGEPYKPVVDECVEIDTMPWSEFGHTPAPQWEKVRAPWRRELLTREQLVERFGDNGKNCALTQSVSGLEEETVKAFGDVFKRAEVFEIWDKPTRSVIWISPGFTEGPLDVKDDPLELDDFFPCPEPLYATTTNDSLVPVADYDEYRTQADEIDQLTDRIRQLTKAVRIVGTYNGAHSELQNILTGQDNRLVPVDSWALFAEKGGTKGNIDIVDVTVVVKVIESLTSIRTQLIEDLFQISGISDIVRGESKPSETLGAQRIKQQFAGMRLQDAQQDVARFARDTVYIVAEIICRHFSPTTLRDISDWDNSDEAKAHDKAVADWQQKQAQQLQQMMAAQMQPQGQVAPGGVPAQPPPGQPGAAAVPPAQGMPQGGPVTQPPMAPPSPAQQMPGQMPPQQQAPQPQPQQLGPRPPSSQEIFDAAVKLLRDERLRGYRIDIETDQMVLDDKQQEQQNRVQFIQAVSMFLQQAVPAGQMYPQLAPLLIGMLDWGIRGFAVGRDLEALFDETTDDFMEAHKASGGLPPQLQGKAQYDQGRLQIDQQRLQMEMQQSEREGQLNTAKAQRDAQMQQLEMSLKSRQVALDEQKAMRDAQTPPPAAPGPDPVQIQKVQNDAQKNQTDAALRSRELDLEERKVALAEHQALMADQKAAAELEQLRSMTAGAQGGAALADTAGQALTAITQAIAQMHQVLSAHQASSNAPRKTRLIRDPNTNQIVGAETVQ